MPAKQISAIRPSLSGARTFSASSDRCRAGSCITKRAHTCARMYFGVHNHLMQASAHRTSTHERIHSCMHTTRAHIHTHTRAHTHTNPRVRTHARKQAHRHPSENASHMHALTRQHALTACAAGVWDAGVPDAAVHPAHGHYAHPRQPAPPRLPRIPVCRCWVQLPLCVDMCSRVACTILSLSHTNSL